ncbi:hypothetical protein [Streptomyces lydicus]|uniref:hypothetical protein n=1 Tax=Streptomyces lydicus TaxID=47763 RepID=UPI0036EE8F2F
MAHARQQVRRLLRQTPAVPFALPAALVVPTGLLPLLTPSRTVLERQSHDRLRPGDARSRVEAVLPFFALDAPPDGTPPPPPGRSCVHYGVSPDGAAYELCLAGDRLATKRVARERPRRQARPAGRFRTVPSPVRRRPSAPAPPRGFTPNSPADQGSSPAGRHPEPFLPPRFPIWPIPPPQALLYGLPPGERLGVRRRAPARHRTSAHRNSAVITTS